MVALEQHHKIGKTNTSSKSRWKLLPRDMIVFLVLARTFQVVVLFKTFPMIGHKSYKNKYEMTMIAKSCRTYVSLGNLGLSLGEVHCSSGNLTFPQGTTMYLRRRSLNYPGEQIKPLFSLGNNHVP
jgi:hypothetical protein